MSDEKKVVVIGAGNLGRRHLQGLALCESHLEIFVVDPFAESLDAARRVAVESNVTKYQVGYLGSLKDVGKDIDLAIVATAADVRLQILKELIDNGVESVILEKVLFNSIADIESAKTLLASWSGHAWVNCPRREYSVYKQLKKILDDHEVYNITVSGNSYGLACNGIHFIDLMAYLLGDYVYRFSASEVSRIIKSKRQGYVEFIGCFEGEFSSGCPFSLTCWDEEDIPSIKIHIEFNGGTIDIDELNGTMWVVEEGGTTEQSFKMPYQSQLTGPLVDKILAGRECRLTKIQESLRLHESFVRKAYACYAQEYGHNDDMYVPIT